VAGVQVSTVQSLPSSQTTAVALHTPLASQLESQKVPALPGPLLQGAPSARRAVKSQAPVLCTQRSTVQSLPSPQTLGTVVHTPAALQVELQRLSSWMLPLSQGVPAASF
jgi:hypothetical protein